MRPWLLLLALALTACRSGPSADPSGPTDSSASSVVVHAGKVVIAEESGWKADPVTIASASIRGDSLQLVVRYGGGCREHAFTLVVAPAWMESYPVQASALLAHDAGGDNCKALIEKSLGFDLSPVKARWRAGYGQGAGKISLSLRPSGVSVLYEFD